MRDLFKPAPIIFILAVCSLSQSVFSDAAELDLRPRISVSEEFNDNINESAVAVEEDFITHVTPGFALRYQTPRIDATADYSFDYLYYSKGTESDEYNNTLAATTKLTIIENLFFVDLSDTYRRVSLDVARDTTNDLPNSNYSDQNNFNVSPYFTWRLGEKSTLKTGYRYTNIWYKESDGIDRQEHSAFLDGSYEIQPKLFLICGYSYTYSQASESTGNPSTGVNPNQEETYDRHTGYGGFRYEYAERSFIFGQGGYSYLTYEDGTKANDPYWNVGITHEASLVTVTLETRVQYTEDPTNASTRETLYSGRIERKINRGDITLSGGYSEFKDQLDSSQDEDRTTIGISGRYELMDSLTLSLGIGGEHYTRADDAVSNPPEADNYPYRLNGRAGLSYAMNQELSLFLNYQHTTYQNTVWDTSDSIDVNRVFLGVTKLF